MILKFACTVKNGVQQYVVIENTFKNALSDFDFIDTVDYDGEYLNLIVQPNHVQSAFEKESEMCCQVNQTILTLAEMI